MTTHAIVCKECQVVIGITDGDGFDPQEGGHVGSDGNEHKGSETYLLGEAVPEGDTPEDKLQWAQAMLADGKGILRK